MLWPSVSAWARTCHVLKKSRPMPTGNWATIRSCRRHRSASSRVFGGARENLLYCLKRHARRWRIYTRNVLIPEATMEWKTRRIDAILEQALLEDKVTHDATTALTIDPLLRASATVLAKQDCVLSGIGCIPRFLEIFATLDKRHHHRFEVIHHPEIFDGVRVKRG